MVRQVRVDTIVDNFSLPRSETSEMSLDGRRKFDVVGQSQPQLDRSGYAAGALVGAPPSNLSAVAISLSSFTGLLRYSLTPRLSAYI